MPALFASHALCQEQLLGRNPHCARAGLSCFGIHPFHRRLGDHPKISTKRDVSGRGRVLLWSLGVLFCCLKAPIIRSEG